MTNNKLIKLQVEQRAIFEANDGGKRPLTWVQIRNNMPVTNKVYLDTYMKCFYIIINQIISFLVFSQKIG